MRRLHILASLLILMGIGIFMNSQNPAGGYTSPAQGGIVTPAGANGAVQFNNSGALGGFGVFTAGAPNTLALGATSIQSTQGGSATPAIQLVSGGVIGLGGGAPFIQFSSTDLVLATFGPNNIKMSNPVNALAYQTTTNCAVNSVSPAACGSAPAGSFVVPTTTTAYTVNTTRATATSRIFLFPHTDTRDLPGAPTCTVPVITTAPTVSGIVAATSFSIAIASTTGQTCWDYWIVN